MPRIYSYVVEHDLGFAPNPFGRICTLANCKPQIRKVATVGDLLIGTGSATVHLRGHLVYWMRVSEILSFDDYWSDQRFRRKKPNMRGGTMHRYGDNIYWTGDDGTFNQLDSFHSEADGTLSIANRKRDTGTTEKVLIGHDFAYFGKQAPKIPDSVSFIVKKGPGHKCKFSNEQQATIQAWLAAMPERGYIGEPCHW